MREIKRRSKNGKKGLKWKIGFLALLGFLSEVASSASLKSRLENLAVIQSEDSASKLTSQEQKFSGTLLQKFKPKSDFLDLEFKITDSKSDRPYSQAYKIDIGIKLDPKILEKLKKSQNSENPENGKKEAEEELLYQDEYSLADLERFSVQIHQKSGSQYGVEPRNHIFEYTIKKLKFAARITTNKPSRQQRRGYIKSTTLESLEIEFFVPKLKKKIFWFKFENVKNTFYSRTQRFYSFVFNLPILAMAIFRYILSPIGYFLKIAILTQMNKMGLESHNESYNEHCRYVFTHFEFFYTLQIAVLASLTFFCSSLWSWPLIWILLFKDTDNAVLTPRMLKGVLVNALKLTKSENEVEFLYTFIPGSKLSIVWMGIGMSLQRLKNGNPMNISLLNALKFCIFNYFYLALGAVFWVYPGLLRHLTWILTAGAMYNVLISEYRNPCLMDFLSWILFFFYINFSLKAYVDGYKAVALNWSFWEPFLGGWWSMVLTDFLVLFQALFVFFVFTAADFYFVKTNHDEYAAKKAENGRNGGGKVGGVGGDFGASGAGLGGVMGVDVPVRGYLGTRGVDLGVIGRYEQMLTCESLGLRVPFVLAKKSPPRAGMYNFGVDSSKKKIFLQKSRKFDLDPNKENSTNLRKLLELSIKEQPPKPENNPETPQNDEREPPRARIFETVIFSNSAFSKHLVTLAEQSSDILMCPELTLTNFRLIDLRNFRILKKLRQTLKLTLGSFQSIIGAENERVVVYVDSLLNVSLLIFHKENQLTWTITSAFLNPNKEVIEMKDVDKFVVTSFEPLYELKDKLVKEAHMEIDFNPGLDSQLAALYTVEYTQNEPLQIKRSRKMKFFHRLKILKIDPDGPLKLEKALVKLEDYTDLMNQAYGDVRVLKIQFLGNDVLGLFSAREVLVLKTGAIGGANGARFRVVRLGVRSVTPKIDFLRNFLDCFYYYNSGGKKLEFTTKEYIKVEDILKGCLERLEEPKNEPKRPKSDIGEKAVSGPSRPNLDFNHVVWEEIELNKPPEGQSGEDVDEDPDVRKNK